jgi:hypothetical protein
MMHWEVEKEHTSCDSKADDTNKKVCKVGLLLVVPVYYESTKPELKRRLMYEYRCDERLIVVVYYKSINRELKKRCIYESRCDERLILY